MRYRFSKAVKFHPWVGKEYESQPKKILLLGESHYRYKEGEPDKEFTRDVVKECIKNSEKSRFFGGLLYAIYGKIDNKQAQFDKIAFYNFVQNLVGDGPRVRPTKADFEEAQKPFLEVLDKLSPTYVISFGDDMTFHFPPVVYETWPEEKSDDEHKPVYLNKFDLGDRKIPVYCLPHPSGPNFNRQTYFEYCDRKGLTIKD